MASKNVVDLLNKQINAEIFSSYLYLSMSSASSYMGLRGAASWFFVQSQEEMTHAQRIYNYVNSIGARVLLEAIDQPQTEFESLLSMMELTLDHEKKVTGLINNIVNNAADERDHATTIFLQWFVTEQVEEEENVNEVLSRVKLAGADGSALFMVDNELGTRAFTMPADLVAK